MIIKILLALAMAVLSLFLLLIILVQKGRGGGLAGALGGAGGSSAFGAKAGDTFTKITIVVASIWILTCAFSCFWYSHLAKQSVTDEGMWKKPAAESDAAGTTSELEAIADSAEPAAETTAENAPAEGTPAEAAQLPETINLEDAAPAENAPAAEAAPELEAAPEAAPAPEAPAAN
ncbi:MAG: preprotein translocase subunit SecG [Thermoguttaceae bacterium]|nr:preprotein translocase subunit SecG [Thermoguttaceae bacterium]